jgi:hypothetical protein
LRRVDNLRSAGTNKFEEDYIKHLGHVFRSELELWRNDEGDLFIKAIKK